VLDYTPPAGVVGAAVARLFGEEPNQQIQEELRHFKQLMETGELASTRGQAHGKRSVLGQALGTVERANEPEPTSQHAEGQARFAGAGS